VRRDAKESARIVLGGSKTDSLSQFMPRELSRLLQEDADGNSKRTDLLQYVIATYPKYKAGWVHKEICTALMQFEKDLKEGKSPRLAIFLPPRHGKSFICSERFPVWYLGRNPDHWIILSSYGQSLSNRFSKRARDLMEDPATTKTFPTLEIDKDKRAVEEWETTQGGGYKAVGVGGPTTGTGANVLIIDDPFKDWEEANNQNQRDQIWDWYTSVAMTRLAPESGVILIQTRWHEDDLAGRILKLDEAGVEKWKVLRYPAICEEDEEHRKIGDALHPDRYPITKLNAIKEVQSERIWHALYQQNPRPPSSNVIKEEWFKVKKKDEIPFFKELRFVRYWDLAVKAKKSNDDTASAMVAIHSVKVDDELYDEYVFIKDVVKYKKTWMQSKKTIVETAKRENVVVGVENVGAMDFAIVELREALRGHAIVIGIHSGEDKLTRALPWIDKAESGRVILIDGPWIPAFKNECSKWDPAGSSEVDNQIDSVSGAYKMVKKSGKRGLILI
jgi:predicted phage terminase large subunit-like protein